MRVVPSQKGFEAVGLLVVVAFLAIVGFAAFKVVGLNKSAASSTATTASAVRVPATIKTSADLKQTDQALQSTGQQAENSLNADSLDADLNAML